MHGQLGFQPVIAKSCRAVAAILADNINYYQADEVGNRAGSQGPGAVPPTRLSSGGLSLCLSVCLSVCLPACLPACLPPFLARGRRRVPVPIHEAGAKIAGS